MGDNKMMFGIAFLYMWSWITVTINIWDCPTILTSIYALVM